MRTMRRWTSAAVCVCLLLPMSALAQLGDAVKPAAAADPSALLKVIPADATGFIAVSSLRQLDTHVQAVAQQLQLQGIVPGPLDWLKTSTGITQGLNEDGGVAMVILNCGDMKTMEEIGNRLALYIPSTDPNKLIETLGGTKEGETMMVTLMGQPSAAEAKDGFLVLTEKPETLKDALAAKEGGIEKTLSPDRVKAFASQDVFAWFNPGTLSQEIRAQINGMLAGAMPPGQAPLGPGGPGDQINKMLDELQEVSAGVSLDATKGLTIAYYARAKEGTETAAQLEAMQPTQGSLLEGLPNEPSIFAVGSVGFKADSPYGKQLDQLIEKMLQMYQGLLASSGLQVEEGKLMPLKVPLVKMLTTMEQIAVSFSLLPAEGGAGQLGFTVVARVKNSQQWQAQAKLIFESVKQIVVDIVKQQGHPEDKVNEIAGAFQWKEKAEQSAGASVDHFVVDIDTLAKTDEEKAEIEQAKGFLGQEGVLIRIAAVGDDHAVITFGGGAKRFEAIAEVVKKKESPLAQTPEIQKVADRLPKGPRIMEGYANIDHLLTMVSTAMNQMGTGMPFPLALANAAPIALSTVKFGDRAQQTELLIPIELMTSVKDMVGPLLMMFGGGGGEMPTEEPVEEVEPGGELN